MHAKEEHYIFFKIHAGFAWLKKLEGGNNQIVRNTKDGMMVLTTTTQSLVENGLTNNVTVDGGKGLLRENEIKL